MIQYLISSHVRYAPFTLPRLLASMSDVEPDRIFPFIGGADNEATQTLAGVRCFLVPHNSYDYTALVGLLDLGLESDWWFWLHDTCQCGPRFRELAEAQFDPAADMTAAYLHPMGGAQSNLGMYRHALFTRHRESILTLRDCSKQAACEAEGFAWKWRLGAGSVYPNARCLNPAVENVYGLGTPRLVEYYTAVDLYKFKANWGQGGPLVVHP